MPLQRPSNALQCPFSDLDNILGAERFAPDGPDEDRVGELDMLRRYLTEAVQAVDKCVGQGRRVAGVACAGGGMCWGWQEAAVPQSARGMRSAAVSSVAGHAATLLVSGRSVQSAHGRARAP